MNIGDDIDLCYSIDEFLLLDFGHPERHLDQAEKAVYTYFKNDDVVCATNVVFYKLHLFNFYNKIRRR